MLNSQDQILLKKKGIKEEQVNLQLQQHKSGFPYSDIQRPATPGGGIIVVQPDEESMFLNVFDSAVKAGLDICKFVPASGAATRMFKDLFGFLQKSEDQIAGLAAQPPYSDFFERLKDFAFYKDLIECGAIDTQNRSAQTYKLVVDKLLNEDGLNYGKLPKGVLKFHRYDGIERTPMEEHLSEAALYGKSKDGKSFIHFTVSQEHEKLFKQVLESAKGNMEEENKTTFEVSFSNQKPSTDTIAATPDNEPFRQENGDLLFRPGGHGALIQNLNDLDHDVIFIKNIDNVVPDHLVDDTVLFKKLLAGILLNYRNEVFDVLTKLDNNTLEEGIDQGLNFIKSVLQQQIANSVLQADNNTKAEYIRSVLNRPMRVCGMVKNEGEPGGGPFWVKNHDGIESLQIVESSQIDMSDSEKKKIVEESTHFNPVDLVCAIKDYKGNKFNLLDFVDPLTGFISEKSINGKPLKALELPGLWNGAMANWNTFFVEVPITTFNPVKTVFDLLRAQHQPE